MSKGNYNQFFDRLGLLESGDDYAFVGSDNELGRYQLDEAALIAVKFVFPDKSPGVNDYAGRFTGRQGVTSEEGFLFDPEAQDVAARLYMKVLWAALGDDTRFEGQVLDGHKITTSGLIAGAFLAGEFGMRTYLESGGDTNPLGAELFEYLQKLGNFDTPFIVDHSIDESISGGAGNDRLTGFGGNDVLDGEGGDDVLDGGDGEDEVRGGDGLDKVFGGASGDILFGGNGDDALRGEDGADLLLGQAGSDNLAGGDGDDTLDGAESDDTLKGGAGGDTLLGGDGGDNSSGGADDDTLDGGLGNDLLKGNDGDDTLNGGGGDDDLKGAAGADLLHGQAGADTLDGGGSSDTLEGGGGNDNLSGGNDNDTLSGGLGDDFMLGDSGDDMLDGGDGLDSVQGGDGDDALTGGLGNDVLVGGDGDDLHDGGDGSDYSLGGEGDDTMLGGLGLDTLLGDNGNDLLDGGEDRDFMSGGAGNDTYILSEHRDFVLETLGKGGGNDKVIITAGGKYAFANVEQVRIEAGSAIKVTVASGQIDSLHFDSDDGGTIRYQLSAEPEEKIIDVRFGAGKDIFVFDANGFDPATGVLQGTTQVGFFWGFDMKSVEGNDRIDLSGLGIDLLVTGTRSRNDDGQFLLAPGARIEIGQLFYENATDGWYFVDTTTGLFSPSINGNLTEDNFIV